MSRASNRRIARATSFRLVMLLLAAQLAIGSLIPARLGDMRTMQSSCKTCQRTSFDKSASPVVLFALNDDAFVRWTRRTENLGTAVCLAADTLGTAFSIARLPLARSSSHRGLSLYASGVRLQV